MNRTGNCVLLTTTFLLLTACGGGSGDQPVSESKSPQSVEAGEPNVESDIPRCPSIRVVFKDGAKLLIEGAHETSSGWGADEGIQFFSAP